jgi:phage-related protein
MIVFNGIALESVAPVKIEDIRVSPIKYSPVVRPRAVRFGSEFVRMVGGERTITLSFALLERNATARQEFLRAMSVWAKTDAEYRLELPIDPAKYLVAVCTAKPEPSVRAWWENKLKLLFTCFDNPYWTSMEEKSVACGTAFTVQGDAPPLMRIERTLSSAASNQTYSNGSQSMTFSTISAGNMVIDLNRQTAQVGTASIMQYYQASGSFIVPRTGTQTISGTGTVKYRERWE